jgi:hypothetical protein
MIRLPPRAVWRNWLVIGLAAGQLAVWPLAAETVTNVTVAHRFLSAPTNLPPPPMPHAESPVDLFRKLLAMTTTGQHDFLTNRPPAVRLRIQAKLREYAALDPNERELRLRATELRWYLLPLLHESPTNRAAQLTAIPADLRALVNARLLQWDILPPPLQTEFFESEHALRYFTHVDPSNGPPMPPMPPLSPGQRQLHSQPGPDLAHWNSLSGDEHQRITDQFNQFFELTPAEKQKTLNTLSDAERRQMEKTLETFGQLPRGQRLQCLRAFTEFAGMSTAEKQDFLKNAQHWTQMSPKERQTWRDLVTHVPQWPPLPSTLTPPMPPPLPPPLTQRAPPALATNHN